VSSAEEETDALPATELATLERRLQAAFTTGNETGLHVLGYGEISSVLAWTVGEDRFACKRLPEFDGMARFERYRELFERYLRTLEDAGIPPVRSTLQTIALDGGHLAVWCIQPMLPANGLLPNMMRESLRKEAVARFETICDRVHEAVGPTLGLDGQLSNWVLVDGEVRYLDVTTPLLRDASGTDELDADLFLASLPWALRPVVKRVMLTKIVDKYFEPRGVVLDLLGNLEKERLDHLLAPFLEIANARIEGEPITADEARRYYDEDARTWALLQRLRRIDRAWQRTVRRRPYPFLLPGDIER
jgi:hypothetical protein